MARMLWAFNLDVGLSEETGDKVIVDDMAGSEGFVFVPKLFPAVYTVRKPWIRSLLLDQGYTHITDHAKILDQAGKDRVLKLSKR